MQAHVRDFEPDVAARSQARFHQILDDLVLCVDHHGLAAGQLRKIDAAVDAVETQDRSFMPKALAFHAGAHTDLFHEIDGALFQHTSADRGLDRLAAARLQNDRLDALEVEDVGEHQPCRACSDDCDLRFHDLALQSRRIWFLRITAPHRSRSART